jgi:pantothenate synthetase
MSSRNRRLSTAQRDAAVCVPRSLQALADALAAGIRDVGQLVEIGREVVLAQPLARFEHLEIVNPDTLRPLDIVDERAVAVTAVWFGDVRLIDNQLLAAGRPA